MKRLLASTALAVLASAAAQADEVVIKQRFDDFLPQTVINDLSAKLDITNGVLEGTNIQNVMQWRDASTDAGLHGDIYQLSQYTDEEQFVLNSAYSKYGDVGAKLSATNLQNLLEIEDRFGGTELVGDHILIKQKLDGTLQVGVNKLEADKYGSILPESAASVTNLGNVASITDQFGGETYGNIIRLDQSSKWTTQLAVNVADAGYNVGKLNMEGLNGVNIASFDLKDQTGKADIEIEQTTRNLTQLVANSVNAGGNAANVSMAGTNLANIITFAAAPTTNP
jgi:opacity protein-like surface antigen